MKTSCAEVSLDGYLGRDPAQWHGFAPYGEEALDQRYHFAEGAGRALRGEQMVEYKFRAMHRPDFTHPFLFHFHDDRLAVIETDFWSLDPVLCRGLLDDIAEPTARIDAHLRFDTIVRADWVYPERGIALCVMPETGLIARWTAFIPCSIDSYCDAIRPMGLAREFEPRR